MLHFLIYIFSPRYGFALLNSKEYLLIAVGGKSIEDKGEGPIDLNQGKLKTRHCFVPLKFASNKFTVKIN